MKSNSLVLDRLVVAREGAPLTSPISLRLEGGEMLAIHGSNGSGKSTLLKTIAGLIRPYEGGVRFIDAGSGRHPDEGRDPCQVARDSSDIGPGLRRGDDGGMPAPVYLGHRRGLTPSMSVYDNVAFWAKASGHPELVDAAMRYWDLQDIPDVIVDTLSAGWQQRVALTRLITIPSPIWLLDEPTSNLDADGIALLQCLMQTRLEQGGMILVATHLQLQGDKVKTLKLSMIEESSNVNV